MHFAHGLGIRIMLSEFSPIPGTPDGEQCRRWIDMDEPLRHNKTAFVIDRMGAAEINRLKNLASRLNRRLGHDDRQSHGVNLLHLGPDFVQTDKSEKWA